MIDAEHAGGRSSSQTRDLWIKESRRDASQHHEGADAMEVRHAHPRRGAGNFGIMPANGEEDRCIEQIAEVVTVVGVLPQIIRVDYQYFAHGLLKAGVEFVSV